MYLVPFEVPNPHFVRRFNVFPLFVSTVHRNNRGWEDGAYTEVGRQRDQSGQGSQRQCPHSGKVLTQHLISISLCWLYSKCLFLSPSQTLKMGEIICKRNYEKAE